MLYKKLNCEILKKHWNLMQQDKEGIVLDFTCRIIMIKTYFRLVSYVKLPIPTMIVLMYLLRVYIHIHSRTVTLYMYFVSMNTPNMY